MAEKEKVHDGLIVYEIGGQKFELRELKIKKVKKLAEELFFLHADLQKFLKEKSSEDSVESIDPMFAKGIRKAIARTMNFLFGLEGENKLSADWWEENATYSELEDIVKEAAAQSRMDWLPPFFAAFCHTASSLIPFLTAKGKTSGNPTT